MSHHPPQSEALVRAWLLNRANGFVPRIKKLKPTKSKPYTFSLEQLSEDMRRTLIELNERILEFRADQVKDI